MHAGSAIQVHQLHSVMPLYCHLLAGNLDFYLAPCIPGQNEAVSILSAAFQLLLETNGLNFLLGLVVDSKPPNRLGEAHITFRVVYLARRGSPLQTAPGQPQSQPRNECHVNWVNDHQAKAFHSCKPDLSIQHA